VQITSPPSVTIGSTVRAELARRRFSQTSLAQALGISQTGVSSRLRGKVPFDVDELHAVADFLNLPVSSLLDDARVARAG
jgi:transcriptional regulator with XRE-family HTH domain